MLLSRVDHVPRDRRASGVPVRRCRRADIRLQQQGTGHADRPIYSGNDRRYARTAAACAAVTDTRAGSSTTVTAGATGHAEAAYSAAAIPADTATAHATTANAADAAAEYGQAL